MKATIEGAPAFGHLQVVLERGDSIIAESGAMASMSAAIEMRTQLNGGVIGAILRRVFGGESIFINRFSNQTPAPERLTLVQPAPGDLHCRELAKGEVYFLQPGAFVACDTTVGPSLKWAGIVSFIAREGLFKIAVTGPGRVWFGAYGALLERDVDGELIVDSSHLVAYEPGIKLHLQLAGGLVASVLGGEGLVTRVTGRGKIVVQTRSITGLAAWLNPKF
jgi:uncharacterized protein (TIGR00266 family)